MSFSNWLALKSRILASVQGRVAWKLCLNPNGTNVKTRMASCKYVPNLPLDALLDGRSDSHP